MKEKEEELVRRFADMSDDVLLKRLQSGDMTELAESLARAELQQRGLEVPTGDEHASAQEQSLPLPSDYVQLAGYLQPMEAYVLEGRLHAEGIHAHLVGAKTIEANPLWLNAMGGVRIFVPRSEYQQARDILDSPTELDDDEQDDLPPEPARVVAGEEKVDADANKRRWGWLLLMVPSLVFAAVWIVSTWTTPCPPSHLCERPDQSSAVGILIKLLWSVVGLAPAAFATRYLGNRFKRRPATSVSAK